MPNNSGTSSSRGFAYDPTLLQPIVRSKRTPIACTECRRRQVKCSGGTPRCQRCTKKNIDCTYMSLSEQRAVSSTGGSISRSGTPTQATSHLVSGHAHGHRHGASALVHSSMEWTGGMQGYAAGSAYTSQGPTSGTQYDQHGMQASQHQTYAGLPVAYQQGYGQAAYATQGGSPTANSNEMYAAGYAQQGYTGGTTAYDGYGQTVPTADPKYAYQMATMTGGDQQGAAYMGQQFAQQQQQHNQQMYIDPVTGQVMSADVTGQWAADNTNTAYQSPTYPGQH